jgi:hypothetical protein
MALAADRRPRCHARQGRGLRRLKLTVMTDDFRTLGLYLRGGFKVGGLRRQALVRDGSVIDEYYMGNCCRAHRRNHPRRPGQQSCRHRSWVVWAICVLRPDSDQPAPTRRGTYQVVGPRLMTMRTGMHRQAHDMTSGSLPRGSNRNRHRR